MAQNENLIAIQKEGWTRGFSNLFLHELSLWKRTKKWWVQIALWLIIINLMLVFIIGVPALIPDEEATNVEEVTIQFGTFMYGLFGSMWPLFGVIILMQFVIVGEKNSGVAAWILSKPVSRLAYVASKLFSNTIGILITMIFIPGLVAYLELTVFFPDYQISPINFLLGMGLLSLHAMFYLSLTLLLGTIYDEGGPVIGIPLGLLFVQFLVSFFGLANFTTIPLIFMQSETGTDPFSLISLVIMGEALPTIIPIIVTFISTITFIILAFWRFPKDEF